MPKMICPDETLPHEKLTVKTGDNYRDGKLSKPGEADNVPKNVQKTSLFPVFGAKGKHEISAINGADKLNRIEEVARGCTQQKGFPKKKAGNES